MHTTPLDRRQWLKTVGLTGATALLAGRTSLAQQPPPPTAMAATRRRAIRLAHLTGVHVEPERGAGQGMAQCLDHVNAQPDRPELILFGGDCVMESMRHADARVQLQWDLWHRSLQAHNAIPAQFCIGNHDVWG